MNTEDETNMANSAIMLNEAIEKRLSGALLNIFYGMSPKMGWSDDEYDPLNSYDPIIAQSHVKVAIVALLKPALQTMIRQEIINAIAPDNGTVAVEGVDITYVIQAELQARIQDSKETR